MIIVDDNDETVIESTTIKSSKHKLKQMNRKKTHTHIYTRLKAYELKCSIRGARMNI